MRIVESNFEKLTFDVVVQKGGKATVKIPFKDSNFDWKKIYKVKTDCSCTTPEIWADGLEMEYVDNGQMKGVMKVEEKTLYVIYEPKDDQTPKEVLNSNLVSVVNWDGLEWEQITLNIKIINN